MIIKKKTSHKRLYIALAVLALIVVVVLLEATNTTHVFHKAATVSAPPKVTKKKVAQSTINNGTKSVSGGSTVAQGTATDKNGAVPSSGVSTDASQWSTSSSRLITVKSPLRNSTFKSGDTVTGSTSVASQVQYRLIDSQTGVISQGAINVVDGNFTASLSFTPHSGSGSLDIFSVNSDDTENNEVQIPLNF
jgi:hypothetical protein